jgi:hypothetical protein
MGQKITGVEIFDVGTWNGYAFSDADLEGIVKSFDTLSLSGRVPLKFGHKGKLREDDSQPALGWVERVYRKGSKLLADFADVPTVVYESIKKGLYKFVSVELLGDVQAGNRRIPWVLDAVALLGASQPAVGTLADIQQLTMSRRSQLSAAQRLTFAYEDHSMSTDTRDLQKRAIKLAFDSAIKDGRILPRDQLAFSRRYGDDATLDDAEAWISGTPRPAPINGMQSRVPVTEDVRVGERADHTVLRKTRELAKPQLDAIERAELEGRPVSMSRDRVLEQAAKRVLNADRALGTAYKFVADKDGQ